MRTRTAVALYVLADIICVGLGMGVPIFCILLGFPVGWYIARRLPATADLKSALKRIFTLAIATSALTFLGMSILWGRTVLLLFDPAADLAHFGIPMILYRPRASFIGWLALMIAISPFLQFLMTLFGAHAALLARSRASGKPSKPRMP